MRATPAATPTTIPATVPLGSLLFDVEGDVIAGACEAELLLVKVLGLVLGLVLPGLEVKFGELMLGLELGPGVTEGEDAAVALSTGELEAGDVEELVEPAAHIRCC